MALNVFIGLAGFAIALYGCAIILISVLNILFDRKLKYNAETCAASLAVVVFLAVVVYRL